MTFLISLHYGSGPQIEVVESFIQQIFIKSTLCSRNHSRGWDYSQEQSETPPHKFSFYLGRMRYK